MPEYGNEYDSNENEKEKEEWDVTDELDEHLINKTEGKKIKDLNNHPKGLIDSHLASKINITLKSKKSISEISESLDKEKIEKFKPILISQIKHYSRTGDRKEKILDASKKINISTRLSAKKYALCALNDMVNSEEKATLVYNLIFGKLTTSYQSVEKKCDDMGMKLLTTATEWFEILKNRGNKRPSELNVMVEYRICGHKASKIIHNMIKRGCDQCRINVAIENAMQQPLKYKDAEEIGIKKKLKLISSKQEFLNAYKRAKNDTKPTDLNLKWKCLECGNKFIARYSLIAHKKSDHISGCPECGELNNQLIAHKMAEYIFKNYLKEGTFFESDYQLNKIFKKKNIPRILSHHNVHVDTYAELKINNKELKLAIERQGSQHQDSDKGWIAYLGISRNSGSYSDWKKLIKRDNAKVELFKEFNDRAYYLITIPHTIKPDQVFQFILKDFEGQSGIKLNKRNVNWKSLFNKENTKIDKYL